MSTPSYALVRHDPFGEIYAVRTTPDGTITGLCGPLSRAERSHSAHDYEFDENDPGDLDYFNALGTDCVPNESLSHLRDLE